ncbi:hypothetical protein D3C71_1689570 [compost metagenome]
MEPIKPETADRLFEAVKSMLRVVDPPSEQNLLLKGIETGTRYLELPGCFFIKIGEFSTHRVYMYDQGSNELVEVLCTRTYPSDGGKPRTMMVMELLEAMDQMRYLWLPKDSPARKPNFIRPDKQCALEMCQGKATLNSIRSLIAQRQERGQM